MKTKQLNRPDLEIKAVQYSPVHRGVIRSSQWRLTPRQPDAIQR
jgi:hypothetical protein